MEKLVLKFVGDLKANADAYHSGASHEAFAKVQGETWRRIEAAGKDVHEGVLQVLRGEQFGIPKTR